MFVGALIVATLGLASTAYGRIYAIADNGSGKKKTMSFKWDAGWGEKAVNKDLEKAGVPWANLRFDQAKDPLEVLALPEDVFESYLTTGQIIEIVSNPRLKALMLRKGQLLKAVSSQGGEKKFGLGRMRRAIGRRWNAFRGRLVDVNPMTVSGAEQADQVVEAIPPQAYENMSPLLAVTSPRFQVTLRNIAHLFGLTLRVLRVAVPQLISITISVVSQITASLRGDASGNSSDRKPTVPKLAGMDGAKFDTAALRPFHVASLLLDLLEKFPKLHEIIGDRVELFVKELQELVKNHRMRLLRVRRKAHLNKIPLSKKFSDMEGGGIGEERSTNSKDQKEALPSDNEQESLEKVPPPPSLGPGPQPPKSDKPNSDSEPDEHLGADTQ